MSSSKLKPDFNPAVSSANKRVSKLVIVGRSLIKHRNNNGPRMLPWSTDMSIDISLDKCPLISIPLQQPHLILVFLGVFHDSQHRMLF